jgi:dihydrofolate synthase/folylpolyglutamate synthase
MAQIIEELYARKPEHQMRPRLEPTRLAAEMMGNPQQSYPVIHITGTNGKTSTARIIERILREMGLKTGRLTSPHLIRFNERISLDGESVSDERFIETYEDNKAILDLLDSRLAEQGEAPLTFFEAFTALAFQLFADAPIDVLVLEVGIGGEWDATNVADGDVAVFTSIDLDHTKTLGNTVEEIAKTKAGIIKPKSIVVSNAQPESVVEILRDRAQQPSFFFGQNYSVTSLSPEDFGLRFTVQGIAAEYPNLWMPMMGEHQAENAATAIAAVELFLGGRAIADEILRSAISDVVSPGRLQVLSKEPLVVVDGAHNPAGIRSLARSIDWQFGAPKRIALVAMVSDKDLASASYELNQVFDDFVVTQIAGPRSYDADLLAEQLAEHGGNVLSVERDVAKALSAAMEFAADREAALFVTGSLFLVGTVLELQQEGTDGED